MSELFLSTSLETSSTSALYVGWGILVGYDLAFNLDNGSEPFNVPCNDPEVVDVWCPSGSLSDDIGFSRSRAEVDDDDGVRSPINFATAYLDLDWLYGRSKDAADEIRTFDTGHLSLTDDALPPLRADGTWQVRTCVDPSVPRVSLLSPWLSFLPCRRETRQRGKSLGC